MRHLLLATLLSTTLLGGCAHLRTLNDAASVLCELFATDQGEALGMSPVEWCSVKENLDPFLDEILAAQRNATAMSLNRTSGGEAPAPPSDGDGVAPDPAPDEEPPTAPSGEDR